MMLSPPRNQRASPSPCWWTTGFALAFTDIDLSFLSLNTMYLDYATVQPLAIDVKFHDTTCIVAAVTRRYELKRRAERQDQTRQRGVFEVGGARTSRLRSLSPSASTRIGP